MKRRNRMIALSLASMAFALLFLSQVGRAPAQKKSAASKEDPFTANKVWQFQVSLTPAEYEAMQPPAGVMPRFGQPPPKAVPKRADGREVHRNAFGVDLAWAKGNLSVDGKTFEEVGIRYKGNGTIMDSARTIKKSLKIDLDRFGGKGKFYDSKTINLHSGVADPSKCRETIAYSLYRQSGVPAPKTALSEVYLTVPGKFDKQYIGFYTWVEQVNKNFLQHHFGSDKGLLMKPEGVRDFDFRGEDWERYKQSYDPNRTPTAEEIKQLTSFMKLIHTASEEEFRKNIGNYLEIDAFLRFTAATAMLVNPDNFFMGGHNYIVYLHPQTHRIHFIPWDLDRALANFSFFGSNDQQMDFSLTKLYSGNNRFLDRLMAIPEVQEKYMAILKELAAGPFTKENLLKEVERVENLTKDLVARDKAASQERKENIVSMFGNPPALKTFAEKRSESIASQLAGKSKGYTPAGFGFGGGGKGGFGPPKDFKPGAFLGPQFLKALDADKDEKLSKAELTDKIKALFEQCSKDKDGLADEAAIAEVINKSMPAPPGFGGPKGPNPPKGANPPPKMNFGPGNMWAPTLLRKVDANKDNKVSLDEVLKTAESFFDAADTTKSGKLTEKEVIELVNKAF
jgi:spore coat protein H